MVRITLRSVNLILTRHSLSLLLTESRVTHRDDRQRRHVAAALSRLRSRHILVLSHIHSCSLSWRHNRTNSTLNCQLSLCSHFVSLLCIRYRTACVSEPLSGVSCSCTALAFPQDHSRAALGRMPAGGGAHGRGLMTLSLFTCETGSESTEHSRGRPQAWAARLPTVPSPRSLVLAM